MSSVLVAGKSHVTSVFARERGQGVLPVGEGGKLDIGLHTCTDTHDTTGYALESLHYTNNCKRFISDQVEDKSMDWQWTGGGGWSWNGWYQLDRGTQWMRMSDWEVAAQVRESGKYNYAGRKIQLKSNWNFELLDQLATSQFDRQVIMFLKYGWPLHFTGHNTTISRFNHKSADQYPEQIQQYIDRELEFQTMLGPFPDIPVRDRVAVSPMSTRQKAEPHKRRIISDLSWPPGWSVNDGIPPDEYVTGPINLRYPTIDDLCRRAVQLGPGVTGFKKDMTRAFRQFMICPMDWFLLGSYWNNQFYFDKVGVMGCRTAPFCCQSMTSLIRHFIQNMGYWLKNYVDDFMGLEYEQQAWLAYSALERLLRDTGVHEAEEKSVAPTTMIVFLGILFDLIEFQISIPKQKIQQTLELVREMSEALSVSLKTMQRLLGKLQFVGTCVRPGRVMIMRLLDSITGRTDDTSSIEVTENMRKDLRWWMQLLQSYNGVSMMWFTGDRKIDQSLSSDACLTGYGIFSQGQYAFGEFPKKYLNNNQYSITQLEMIALVVAVKLLIHNIRGKKVLMMCDNKAVVEIIMHGRSHNCILQQWLRELTYFTALNDCWVQVVHIKSVDNRKADWLSRAHADNMYKEKFDSIKRQHWVRLFPDPSLFEINNEW